MTTGRFDFAFAIGGAAGQGIATPGNILARLFVRAASIFTPTMPISRSFGAGTFFLRFALVTVHSEPTGTSWTCWSV